jgi:hypothetical protein
MATTIEDGSGKGYSAKVDVDNRLYVSAVTRTEFDTATDNGDAFNINTEFVTITSSVEVPLLYVKNNEDNDLTIAAWFIGTTAASGSSTRSTLMQVYSNPTDGTIITSGTDVTAVNRQIGNANILDADIKKGGDGFTVSGYVSTPVLYQTQGNNARAFGNVQLSVKKGSSLVVTYQHYGLVQNDIYTGFQVYKTKNGE